MAIHTSCTSKMVVGSLSLLFLGASIGMLTMGYYVIEAYKSINTLTSSNYYIIVPATVVICVGVLFLLAFISGCCAACDNRSCFIAFFLLVSLTVGVLITVIVLSTMYKTELQQVVQNDISLAMDKYEQFESGDNATTHQIDILQQYFKCCGTYNYTSWNATLFGQQNWDHVPFSCCKDENLCFGGDLAQMKGKEKEYIYEIGCIQEVENFLTSNLKYLSTGAIVFLVFLVLGLLGSAFRFRCFCLWKSPA